MRGRDRDRDGAEDNMNRCCTRSFPVERSRPGGEHGSLGSREEEELPPVVKNSVDVGSIWLHN